jgi:hypothetical protein
LIEEDLQLFLSGRIVCGRYSQLRIWIFNRVVCVIPPEVLQGVQPLFLPVVRGIDAIREG